MPASGTVENNYFYFEDQGICQRILAADIPDLKTALEAEDSTIDKNCESTEQATQFWFAENTKMVYVPLLKSLQTAVSGWSSVDGCSL